MEGPPSQQSISGQRQIRNTELELVSNGEEVKRSRAEVLIQAPEFTALSETLDNIADRRELMIAPKGTLVGADIKSHRFHFVTINDDDIRGVL